MLKFFLCIAFFTHSLFADDQRVEAHFLIGDAQSAALEATAGPYLVEALGRTGDEKGMLKAWNCLEEGEKTRQLMEKMAWSVIEKGYESSSPIVRVMSLLAAFVAQDARGVVLIDQGLQDHNLLVRRAALQLAGRLRDAQLVDRVQTMMTEEKAWHLRIEAIRAMGSMHVESSQDALIAIIGDRKSTAEDRAAAAGSLVSLTKEIEKEKLHSLLHSERAALRQLGCQLIEHLELKAEEETLECLLQDPDAAVRLQALVTVARLGFLLDVTACKEDPNSEVALLAAWVEALRGKEGLAPWISHPDPELRLMASAALSSVGGVQWEHFASCSDPFVRMNLALGLINQGESVREACGALHEGLTTISKKWMWQERGGLRFLAPSKVKHSDTIPNHPEGVNQVTRLEVLNTLAILEHVQAEMAIRSLLMERSWGVSGMAAALLLTECDGEAMDAVFMQLDDPHPKVRIQAALILALWGRDRRAIATLEEAYAGADREMKEGILEGLGRIGDSSSIPFLIERLNEPSQTLRIISAAALLQLLYH